MGFLILVNYKTYEQSMGKKALLLSRELERASKEHPSVQVAVAPCAPDIAAISSQTELKVYGQHIDPVGMGGFTGKIHPLCLKEAGAIGALINHSEDRLLLADIEQLVSMCKEFGMESIVCTNNVSVTRASAALNPDYVAIEPPELIGGDISVSSAKPELVSHSVAEVGGVAPGVKVLCGAGVKNGVDVSKSIELGACGVLLASGVTKAKDPYSVMLNMVSSAAESL
ncbi:MAG: triose-phosphate isomerase [Candidatus Thermoplasmatota archaeon]|nr:triose-phosphate isomerase [Candidatus Thermoplasmatota archaeon]